MAISDLAKTKPVAPKPGPDCTVCLAMKELPPKDAAGLLSMLSDKRRPYSEIAQRIAKDKETPQWVRDILESTYRRHARGNCAARERLR